MDRVFGTRRRLHEPAHRQVDSDQHLVPSVHAEISAAPRRTASSGSRASCPQTAAMSGTPSGPTSASCTPVCSQSAWLSSASATARAMSLMVATAPTRARASAVCRVTAVSSMSSSSPANASAASGTSAKEASSRPARTRCDHEGDDAPPVKAAANPLIISGTTRQSHAPRRRSNPVEAAHTLDEEHRGTPGCPESSTHTDCVGSWHSVEVRGGGATLASATVVMFSAVFAAGRVDQLSASCLSRVGASSTVLGPSQGRMTFVQ
ncbi:hypothetical protein SAMN05216505_1246 [Streptomyces prasinopilosus]|uniref:Uncharacterized protein n=1 Tax=Streptomyces prasinopilosus TaxID=67344 RepID=A0A1G7BIM5_9ACTN|nr:hypothetical protein SAMN05216505_1246 [Streptomyces prasinopilosus]